jgi:hypothetical protein
MIPTGKNHIMIFGPKDDETAECVAVGSRG